MPNGEILLLFGRAAGRHLVDVDADRLVRLLPETEAAR